VTHEYCVTLPKCGVPHPAPVPVKHSPHSEWHTTIINFTYAPVAAIICNTRVQTSITILLHLSLHVGRLNTMPPVVIVNRHQPVFPVIMTTFFENLLTEQLESEDYIDKAHLPNSMHTGLPCFAYRLAGY
jgi:hypothetical protein